MLQYFAIERFLFRLSRSPFAGRFVLKGALMLRVWGASSSRPTKDVDLLGYMDNGVDSLVAVVQQVCRSEVEADGLVFDEISVTGAKIKEDAEYEGARIRFLCRLENARVSMQIDVGFGDVVVPAAMDAEYPVLLGMPAPRLRVYSKETLVAEKFQAMVFLGRLNSRMKDFFDIWLMARQFDFHGPTLAEAVKATFENRGTGIDSDPVAWEPEFTGSEVARSRWSAFIRKGRFTDVPEELAEVAKGIASFLRPVTLALLAEEAFVMHWTAPGPWNRK